MRTADFSGFGHLSPAALSDAARERPPREPACWRTVAALQSLRVRDRVLGPAYTIRLRRVSTSSDAQRHAFLDAYDHAPPGSIVVVEAVDDLGGAAIGDLVARRLSAIGVAGIVIDGSIRDRATLLEIAPPLWFTRTEVCGIVSREVATEVGGTVSIGGIAVSNGDIVSADLDGTFVVPAASAAPILSTAATIESHEQHIALALEAGQSLRSVLMRTHEDP